MDQTDYELASKVEDDKVEILVIQEIDSPFDYEEIKSEDRTKCGDVFIDGEQIFTLVCGICDNEYDSLELFGKHIVAKHLASYTLENCSVALDHEQLEILDDKRELFNKLYGTNKVTLASGRDSSNKTIKDNENKTKAQLQTRNYEPIFLCTTCGKKFNGKEKLFAHMDKEHYQTSLIDSKDSNNVESETILQEKQNSGGIISTSIWTEEKGTLRKLPLDTYAETENHTLLSIDNIEMLDGSKEVLNQSYETENCSRILEGTKDAEVNYTCDECGRSYNSRRLYVKHAREKHGILVKNTKRYLQTSTTLSSKILDSDTGQCRFAFDEENDNFLELNELMNSCRAQSNVPPEPADNDFGMEFEPKRTALAESEEKMLPESENDLHSIKNEKGKTTSRPVEATTGLEKPYTCDLCGLRYKNETLLDRHANRKHNVPCKRIRNLLEMAALAKKGAKDIVIVSDGQEIVPKPKDSERALKMPKQEPDSDFDDEDDEFFKVETQPKQRRKAVQKIYSCSRCGHMYKHYRSYQAHVKQMNCNKRLKRKRRNRIGPKVAIGKNPKALESFACEYCQAEFDAKKPFEEHVRLAHGILLTKRFVKRECRFCGEVCAGKPGLEEHTRRAHPDKELDTCEYCGKRFNRPRVLREHLNVHLGIKPYQCPHCPRAFVSQSNLMNHIRVHLQIKNHKCTYCDKRFVTTTDKKIHELSHTGERNHQCAECGKLFPTPTRLNDHMRRHLNIKNFKCDVCDRAFYSSALLANHRLAHSEPRYECHLCGKRVKRISVLRRHMNLHGDEKYSCPICEKTFSEFSTLRAHHKSHSEIVDIE